MKDNDTINWNTLAKKLAGETDEREQKEITAWLQESASNADLYNEIKGYWNHINSIKEMNQFDVNNGWEKLHNRIVASSGSTDPVKKIINPGRSLRISMPWLRVAATIALVMMIGAGSYLVVSGLQKKSMVTVASSASDDQTRLTLPDGTLVFLNAGTRISYSKKFNSGEREVWLTGEAFFDVTHNPENPFIVYSGKAGIKVLGTTFNVQALRSSRKVEVFVESGRVQLFEAENISNTITIEPGFIGSMHDAAVEKQKNTDENYLAWKTKKLTFNNTDMAKVAKGIQDVFKVKVIFENPEMSRCPIESKFDNASLEEVLKSICLPYNWEWQRNGDKVKLTGAGC